ncbi:MAG: F0F1 ATP synthase subunit epsilon [Candidatus Kaiserbacteria bacterium]|nr:F0F1 ATP synthase subunit epsilon [Candidatus Kaiserbacteria bacterium]
MSKTLNLRILRIGESLYAGEANRISLKSGTGMVTILPDHTPLITSVEPCTIHVTSSNGSEHRFTADGGVLEVAHNTCTVLL